MLKSSNCRYLDPILITNQYLKKGRFGLKRPLFFFRFSILRSLSNYILENSPKNTEFVKKQLSVRSIKGV